MFSAIYRYRGFIIDSVKRDFQSRYQTSVLGAAWLILQPIAMISVYTLIFSELMRARLAGMDGPFAYSIYLCSGVLTWGLFTETLNSLVNVFLTNANILKKLSFPRICLPIIVTASAFNRNDTTGTLVDNCPVLPYLIGRSQHGNRDIAWQRLRSKLYDFEMRKRQEEAQKLEDTKTDVGWGHQIRSYVLDNSRIKDLRTNVEISATQKVLDGDLDAFIEASLKQGV